MDEGGGYIIIIMDALNTTVVQRRRLMERCWKNKDEGARNTTLLFMEILVDNPVLLENNYHMKISNDDYGRLLQ